MADLAISQGPFADIPRLIAELRLPLDPGPAGGPRLSCIQPRTAGEASLYEGKNGIPSTERDEFIDFGGWQRTQGRAGLAQARPK